MQTKQEKVFADIAQGAPSQGLDPDSRSLLDTLPRGVVTIWQRSNRRFVDAHQIAEKDYALVTRPAQDNNTQRGYIKCLGGNISTLQEQSNFRAYPNVC